MEKIQEEVCKKRSKQGGKEYKIKRAKAKYGKYQQKESSQFTYKVMKYENSYSWH